MYLGYDSYHLITVRLFFFRRHIYDERQRSKQLLYRREISRLQFGFLLTQLTKAKKSFLATSFGKLLISIEVLYTCTNVKQLLRTDKPHGKFSQLLVSFFVSLTEKPEAKKRFFN